MRRHRRSSLFALALLAPLAVALPPAHSEVVGTIGDTTVERYAGDGRVQTAIAVSAATFASAQAVVLARSDQYADALVGAPLATKLGGPILLTPGGALPAEVRTEIDRLGPTQVVLLGGESALSPAIADSLQDDYTVRRIAGSNRFATGAAVAQELDGSTAFVAEGANASLARGWPDALSIAPLAAHLGHPIMLVTSGSVPADTAAALQAAGTKDIVIAGGTAAVSDAVAATLASGRTVDRLAGTSRFETSAAIYDRSVAEGMSSSGRWLATGFNFPDALAAGPAVAAAGEVMMLVDGKDLGGVPAITARLKKDCASLDRIVLLGGTGVISAAAVDQLTAVLAAAGCATAGVGEECADDAFPSGLLGIVQGLDPDGDPDGDGFTTKQERTTLAFDPVADPTRFNPLIADVPRLSLDLRDDITVEFHDESGTTRDDRYLTVNESERVESSTDSVTDTVSETHTVGAGAEGGKGAGFKVSANYEYQHATTNEVTSSTTVEERTRVATEAESILGSSYTLTGGALSVSADIRNTGDVDFKLDEIALNVEHIDQAGNLQLIGTAVPDAMPDTGIELLAGQAVQLLFTVDGLGSSTIQFVAEDLSGLRIGVRDGFVLSSIGAVGLTAQTQSFGQYQQTVRQNTFALTIDHEPGGEKQDEFVSTTFRRNADGTPTGVELCEVIGTILGETASVSAPETLALPGGETAEVSVLTGLTQQRAGVTTSFDRDYDANAYWILDTNTASVGGATAFDFGDVLLRAQEAVRLVYVRDADDDGLTSRDEVQLHGTSDTDSDSDGDGTADGVEVREGIDVEVVGSAVETVFSDPAAADPDGDGWNDAKERSEGTHPFRADTDGDTVDEPQDVAPLDPGVGGELSDPLAWFAFDADQPGAPDLGVFRDHSGNGFHADGPLTGGGNDGRGPVADRFNMAERAWQGGMTNVDGDRQPEVRAPHLDFGGDLTLSAWINVNTLTRDSHLIAGQPGFLGLQLAAGTGGGTMLVLGEVPCANGDCPAAPALPPALEAPVQLWEGTGVDALGRWVLVTGVASTVNEGGEDGVRLTLYVDETQVASAFTAGGSAVNPGTCAFVMALETLDCGGTDPDAHGAATGYNHNSSTQGGLDDIRVFPAALRPDQVVTLYRERGYGG